MPPKSKSGTRVVETPAATVPLVSAHLVTQNALPNPLDFVFPSEAGTRLSPKNIRRRHVVSALKGLEFSNVR
ncbi:MAG TPA: hypothetical protein VLT62_13185 [Candidatus Methylomirabilis sp.]|nr:hypothetical protein [Candidatus Methylomirabilis sp.]